jgi:peptide/nickel transport system ATP-binding protein
VFTVGHQVTETIRAHEKVSRSAAQARALEMLTAVGIPDPSARLATYPHQLSGGLRQRVMIAIALCCGPQLLIADEPTTAVDVTVQAQLLELLQKLRAERGTSILLISHDIGVIAQTCDRMMTMYAGEVVEAGPVDEVLIQPAHPYTIGLLGAQPNLHTRGKRLATIPGRLPQQHERDDGCLFERRCPAALDPCRTGRQTLADLRPDHQVRCWRAPELVQGGAT